MARTVVITERDENRVAYDIKDEKGVVVESGAKPIAPLLEKMRSTRRNLETVLARELGAGAVPAPMTTAVVDVAEPDATPLGLDELYDHFAEKGHEHDPPDLTHRHDDLEKAYVAIDTRHEDTKVVVEALAARVGALETETEALRERLAEHRHRPLEERLAALEALTDAQSARLKAVEDRPVIQPSAFVTAEEHDADMTTIRGWVGELRGANDALRDRVEESVQRNQRAIESIPQPVETPMAEIQRLVRDAVKAAVTDKKGRPVAFLSTQTVNGKERLVLEALDG